MQRAIRPQRPPPAVHGQNIYAYCHVRTKQVLYSLTRVLDSKQSLKQLPDLGANATPTSIRKDLWKPLFTLTLPPDLNPRTPDGRLQSNLKKDDCLVEHAQGIDTFRRLREYRTLHELYWTPPEELSYYYSEADIEEVEDKLRDRGGKKKETAYDIIKRDKKKMRRKAVMDQKANSIADLAEVLRNQAESGLRVEKMQVEAWRNERAKQVRTMVHDIQNPILAAQTARNNSKKLRDTLHGLREEEGKRTKEGELKRMRAREELAQAVKVEKRIRLSIKNAEVAQLRLKRSRQFLRQLRHEHYLENRRESQDSAVVAKGESNISGMESRIHAQLIKEARSEVVEFVDTVEKLLLPKNVGVDLVELERKISGLRSQNSGNEVKLEQLEKRLRETRKATERYNAAKRKTERVLPMNLENFGQVAQIWDDITSKSLGDPAEHSRLWGEFERVSELLQTLKEKRDRLLLKRNALESEREDLGTEKEQADHTGSEKVKVAKALRQFFTPEKQEPTSGEIEGLARNKQREADLEAGWAAHDASWNELQQSIVPLENELANVRERLYEVILNKKKKQALSNVLISRGRDPYQRNFGVVGRRHDVETPQVVDKALIEPEHSKSQSEETDTNPPNSRPSNGNSLAESGKTHSEIIEADPSLPAWHALLPDLKPLPKVVRGMRKRDEDRSMVRLLNAPIFNLDGVRIQWADIMDANYAESWPESIVHEQLGWSRGTAKRVEDEPQLEPQIAGPKVKSPLKAWEEEENIALRRRVDDLTADIVAQMDDPPMAQANWGRKITPRNP